MTKELMEGFYNGLLDINSGYTNDQSVWGINLIGIYNKPDSWWEQCHCFIQILFPNPMPSKMNPDAPIIEDFSVFDGVYKFWITKVVNRFLLFLGIDMFCGGAANDFRRITEWFRPDNHNILRVTRLLIFLKGVGMIAELDALKYVLNSFHANIDGVELRNSMRYTMTIWNNV